MQNEFLNKIFIFIFIIILSINYKSKIYAGGIMSPLIGSKMVGKMAYCANPLDTTTIYHNPAGLLNIGKLRIDIGTTALLSHTSYVRINDDLTKEKPVSPDPPYGAMPFIGIGANLKEYNLAFGIAFYMPHNISGNYPKNGSQRYFITHGGINTGNITPTFAYAPFEFLKIGVGLSFIGGFVDFERAYFLGDYGYGEDGWINMDGTSLDFGFSIGAIVIPHKDFLVGLVYLSQTDLEFEGNLQITLPEKTVNIANSFLSEDQHLVQNSKVNGRQAVTELDPEKL